MEFFERDMPIVADGNILPEQAVRDYHGRLQEANITPHRSLADDLQLTQLDVT